MTQEDIEDLTRLFFGYITKYISENEEIDLENNIRNYITRENRMIEIKLDADVKLFVDIIRTNLKKCDYFEPTQKIRNVQMYSLTENGKAYLRKMQETRNR